MKKLQQLNLQLTAHLVTTYWFPSYQFQLAQFQMDIQRDLKALWNLRSTTQNGWTEKNHQYFPEETRIQIRTLLMIWATGGEEFLFAQIPRDVLYQIFSYIAGRVDVQELIRYALWPVSSFL